jgi:lipoprotein signal peptidase
MSERTDRSFRGLLLSLALFGLLLDQGSKYLVFHWLYNGGDGGRATIIPGAFDLLAQFDRPDSPDHPMYALRTWGGEMIPRVNQGALFGWKGWFSPEHSNIAFAVISLLAALAIGYWSTQKTLAKDPWLCAALGLILAGTLGNLYDRVVFQGVRDFLYWHYAFEWPVFNLADCCLVCGAGLLLLQAFWHKAPVVQPQAVAATAAPVTVASGQ